MRKGMKSSQPVPKVQPDAYLSQANPVSTTLYTILDTAKNVRIKSIAIYVTWGVTQPTPMELVLTIDGQSYVYAQSNPVSGTVYYPKNNAINAESAQFMDTTDWSNYQAFLFEGRSIKVQMRVTWATTQPNPIVCRVKYAKG